ncbi:hypothetical protein ABPG74_018551 [Tetrahymena malaccensis]
MELKQIAIINAKTDVNLYGKSVVDFYFLDNDQQYLKKSENIIDSNNMIIIKSQLNNCQLLGSMKVDDDDDDNTLIHIFQSQDETFWYLNLFNEPFSVFNITQNYIIQDINLQNNKIAIYDNSTQNLIIYDVVKANYEQVIIKLSAMFDLSISIVDWNLVSFIWAKKNIIYMQNTQNMPQIQTISELESDILQQYYCPAQHTVVVLTSNRIIYSINILTKIKKQVNILFKIQPIFYVQCEDSLIVIYYPYVNIIDLITAQRSVDFENNAIPLVSKKDQLAVIFFSQTNNFFRQQNFEMNNYLFEYRFNNTRLFYDGNNKILIGLTGSLKQINIINIPGDQQLFIYESVGQFAQNAIYYYQEKNSLIVVDSSPIIYLCNYLSRDVTVIKIDVNNIQGILMDKNKNIAFLYSNQFILTYQFPTMQFIEAISLQGYNDTSIIQVYLNTQQSLMIVQTYTHIIAFDLTEIVYASSTSLIEYQKVQNLNLNQEFFISYSIINLSLNLYQNSQLIDSLLFEPSQYNIYPYFTQLLLIQEFQFLFIEFQFINIVQADLQQKKLLLLQKVKLINLPDNYFYDAVGNQIFLLYQQNYQLNKINLNDKNMIEINLANFTQGDISMSLISCQFIILPSSNFIQIYDITNQKIDLIKFSSTSAIKFIFKLQIKQFQSYQNNWWSIPYDYEEKINTNDSLEEIQKIVCLIIQEQDYVVTYIINIQNKQILHTYQLAKYLRVTNVVSDPFRKLIYLVNNKSLTLVLSYTLNLITSIQNACLKQAKISYDSEFIYSICPNDIIIYNGLSFQQQFPTINQGLNEVDNFISTKFNNYYIVIQKNTLSLIKIDFLSNYQLVYEIDESYQQLLNMIVTHDINQQTYINLLLSSYENIIHSIFPLSQNQNCYIDIQQQNRPIENIYTTIQLVQNLESIQNYFQQLSLIQINYLDQQCIQSFNELLIGNSKVFSDIQITLVSQSSSQKNNICWSYQDNSIYASYIQNFFLKNMNLQILNTIDLNKYEQMQNFQMYNITLNIQNSLILSNFDKVLFQNIKFYNKNEGQNKIIIQNCKLVIIEYIDIIDIQSQYVIFNLTNNSNVIIQHINISKINNNTIFLMNNNYQVEISDIKINNSSYVNVFQIYLSNFLNITSLLIQSVQFSQILNTQGCTNIMVQHLHVDYCYKLQLIMLQSIKLDNLQYFCKYYMLQDLTLMNSTDVSNFSQSEQTIISDVIILQLNSSLNCFTLNSLQLSLNNFTIQQSLVYLNQPSVIQILSYTDCSIKNLNSSNNQMTILKINQQDQVGQALIYSSQFTDFALQNPVMELTNIDLLVLDKIQIKNILFNDNKYSSIILINQCNNITITESQFVNNTNVKGIAGSIYATDIQFFQIQNTLFKLNQCQQQNGGALSIRNNIEIASLTILSSQFLDNLAQSSTGGAINLVNSNLNMENSVVSSNKAMIGGGIYYQQIIPDFVLEFYKKINKNNTISQNYAKLYGNNLGSTLRSIRINQKDIETSRQIQIIENKHNLIQISQFKSGDQIFFKKIQLLDEESNPIFIPSSFNYTNNQQYSSDIQLLLQQVSVSLQWDFSTQSIQCFGELQSKQFTNDGFKLNAQIMYKPNSQMTLQVVSNLFPQLLDSKGNVYLDEDYLYQNITINFDSCSLGQIVKQQSNSIVCEDCPEGKYSLSLQDNYCLQCPDSAVKCYQSTILLKNGYWRENEQTDQIIFCNFHPNSCQAQSQQSKHYCIAGYKGPLCYSCDTYGDIWGQRYQQIFSRGECYSCEENSYIIVLENLILLIIIFYYIFALLKNIIIKQQAKLAGYFIIKMDLLYLGSTLRQQDKPQIISKILTDHLQILSLLSFFTFNIPSFFKLPIQVSGNSLSLTSKSIDCFFSRYPNLQPLWFYQSLWSLCLPISVLSLYLILGFLLRLFKRNTNIFKYLNTACIFIYLYFYPMVIMLFSRTLNCLQIGDKDYLDLDVNILCYDPKYHKPYVIFYCIPLLFFWAALVPLFLFLKIRNGKIKKWPILIEIKYSFIFAGYKEKYYYWEFIKLIYKSILILVTTLLQQNSLLKVCLLNAAILFQIYVIFKTKPFVIQSFNNLLQRSAILCALSLNLTQIISNIENKNLFLEAILIALLVFSNLQFITQLIIGICLITIQNGRQKRSRVQSCLLYFIQKYPSLFENIQIQKEQVKVSSLLKIKLVKNKVKQLVEYFKQNNFFNQESLQQHFHLQRTQILTSKSSEQNQQANRFTLLSGNDINIRKNKKVNSFKSMREKWSYYTRKTKESPTSQHYFDSQDKIQNIHKEFALTETANMQTCTLNDEFGIQMTSDNNLNKNITQYLSKKY